MIQGTVTEPRPGLLRGMVGLCSVILGVSPGWSLISTLGLAFHEQLGISNVGIGFAAATISIGYVAASLPLGTVVDRSGGQAMLVWASVILAGILGVLAVFGNFWILLVVALLAGTMWAGCVSASNRYSVLIAPPGRRGVVMGVIQATTMLASGLAAFLLPRIANRWGWRDAVVALGVVALLSGVVTSAALRGRHRVPPPTQAPTVTRRGFRFSKGFAALVVFGVCMGVGMHCTWTFLLLFLSDAKGESTAYGSAVLALLFVAAGTGRLLMGWAMDRGVSLWALLVVCAAGGAVSILALNIDLGSVWTLVFTLGIGFTVLSNNTVFILAGLRMVPQRQWAVAASALTAAHVIGGVIGPPLFALVVDHGGGYVVAWTGVATVVLASLPVLRLAARSAPGAVAQRSVVYITSPENPTGAAVTTHAEYTWDDVEEIDAIPGNFYEDLRPGTVYRHARGRTITETDNIWFTLLSNNTNPLHFDRPYAQAAAMGDYLVVSTLTLAVVTGLTVADISENVVANLGWDKVVLAAPVRIGDTLYAETMITGGRVSESRPYAGIVTTKTRGLNQNGEVVMSFDRTILVYRRGHGPRYEGKVAR